MTLPANVQHLRSGHAPRLQVRVPGHDLQGPTLALLLFLHLSRIESDVHERLAARHDGPGMNRQHHARVWTRRFTRWLTPQIVVVTEHRPLLQHLPAPDRALEQAATRGTHP